MLAITDRRALPPGRSPERQAARLAAAGPPGSVAVLLRDKDLAPRERRALAERLRGAVGEAGGRFLVHGDAELAAAVEADGLHLAEGAPAPGRRPGLLGRSCHGRAALLAAADADYALLSPVLPSPGKAAPGEELGWAGFEAACRDQPLPVYALGGLGPADAVDAKHRGAAGLAAIRALWGAQDPEAAVERILLGLGA